MLMLVLMSSSSLDTEQQWCVDREVKRKPVLSNKNTAARLQFDKDRLYH